MRYSLARSRTTISGAVISESESRAALGLLGARLGVSLGPDDHLAAFFQVAPGELAVRAVREPDAHVDRHRLAILVGDPHTPARDAASGARARRRHLLVALALLRVQYLGDARA